MHAMCLYAIIHIEFKNKCMYIYLEYMLTFLLVSLEYKLQEEGFFLFCSLLYLKGQDQGLVNYCL